MKKNINQLRKDLHIYDDDGNLIDIAGEWTVEPCKGQLRNPHKKVHRDLKKQEKKLRKIQEKNNG